MEVIQFKLKNIYPYVNDGVRATPALVVDALVRVALLGVDATVILDVFKGVVHEAPVAAVVAVRGGAVDQVLFGEGHQVPGLAEMLPL